MEEIKKEEQELEEIKEEQPVEAEPEEVETAEVETVEVETVEEAQPVEEAEASEKKEEAESLENDDTRKVTQKIRYDYRTMKYYNMYAMVYKKHFKIIYFILGIVSILFGGGYGGYNIYKNVVVDGQEFSFIMVIFPLIFILFGIYFLYEAICFEKVIDRNITNHFLRNPSVVELEVTVSEKAVYVKSTKSLEAPIPYNWAYISSIAELPNFIYLYVGNQPLIIEKDPNKVISGDYDELLDIIYSKKASKPYKKIEKELVTKPITFVHQDEANAMRDASEAEVVNEERTQDNNNDSQAE